jgi:hypothetical protein
MADDFSKANIVAGAVGSNSMAIHTNIQNFSSQSTPENELLATQLFELAKRMLAEAKSPEQEISAKQIEQAADAAGKGKSEHVVGYLKLAGTWAFGIAEKIGVEVAKCAISKALNIS